jgi:threonine/homoserine/homoserine lactone efflux protein
MTLESTLAFSIAMFILAATPGPGVFASVGQALSGGFRSSLNVIAGIILGDLLYLMLAIFGLSAVARAFGQLFFVVKIMGGGYLIWLGINMWTKQPVGLEPTVNPVSKNGWQRFTAGLFITLSNPKVILFYCGFLPTFMDLAGLHVIDMAVAAGVVATVLSTVMVLYAYSAAQARRLFTSRRAARNLNRGAGTILIGTGVVIATR